MRELQRAADAAADFVDGEFGGAEYLSDLAAVHVGGDE